MEPESAVGTHELVREEWRRMGMLLRDLLEDEKRPWRLRGLL